MKIGSINRRTLAQIVLLAWAGSLAWLARREFGKDESETIAEATVRLSPEAHFYAVKAGGSQIGYASVTIDTMPTGFRLSEVMALDVPEADSTRRVTRRTELVLTRSLRLRSFVRTVTGGGLFEEFAGTIEGDSLLRMSERDSRDHAAEEWTVRIAGDVVLPEVLPYRLAFGKRLEVGRTVTASVLDLSTGTIGRVEFAATAESTFVVADSAIEQRTTRLWRPVSYDTVKAWRIEHAAIGSPVVNWVDQNGGLVFTEAALGVRLERSAFELVSFNYRVALDRNGPDGHRTVPGMTSVVGAGLRPDTGRAASFRIESAPVERFLLPRVAWLAGGRQATAGEVVRVGESSRERVDSGKTGFLDPSEALRPVGPAVAAVARAAADSAAPAAMVARALVDWVHRSIRRDTAGGAARLPARVLAEGRAGPEGMVGLFVDLARARGLRARTVSGVLIADGRGYGHVWAEIMVDGGWVAVDPTFGQMPASPALVRTMIGGSSRAIDLVPILGAASFAPAETVTRTP